MESLFDPVVDRILNLLDKQITETKQKAMGPMEYLVLVGDFTEYRYVQERLSAWCSAQGMLLEVPQIGG
jgi:hypothetical protein